MMSSPRRGGLRDPLHGEFLCASLAQFEKIKIDQLLVREAGLIGPRSFEIVHNLRDSSLIPTAFFLAG